MTIVNNRVRLVAVADEIAPDGTVCRGSIAVALRRELRQVEFEASRIGLGAWAEDRDMTGQEKALYYSLIFKMAELEDLIDGSSQKEMSWRR